MGLRAGEGELQDAFSPTSPCWEGPGDFRVGVWHTEMLSVVQQVKGCWDKRIGAVLGEAQGKMGSVWRRLRSTWSWWDTGAVHPVPSKACQTLTRVHGDTQACDIPFS